MQGSMTSGGIIHFFLSSVWWSLSFFTGSQGFPARQCSPVVLLLETGCWTQVTNSSSGRGYFMASHSTTLLHSSPCHARHAPPHHTPFMALHLCAT